MHTTRLIAYYKLVSHQNSDYLYKMKGMSSLRTASLNLNKALTYTEVPVKAKEIHVTLKLQIKIWITFHQIYDYYLSAYHLSLP